MLIADWCLSFGDAGNFLREESRAETYGTGDASTAGPRHRLIANMMNGDFVFEYEGCDDIVPVNLNMHLD